MMFRSIVVAAAFAALAAGAPANKITSKTFVDTFEDKPKGVAVVGAPVGIENGLFYNGWQVGTALTGSFGGCIPASQVNVAFSGAVTQALNMTATITRDYAGSNVTAFDLSELYVGCAVYTGETVVDVAQGCALTVFGYYANGVPAPAYSIVFGTILIAKTSLTPQPMERIDLPLTFVGLKNATIFLGAQASASADDAVYFVDNVVHTNYYYS